MESPAPEHLLKLGTGFFASKVLLSAVELELFTVLAEGPETLAGISSRVGLHPRSAHDFLDALVALNCLPLSDGHYANTPSTDPWGGQRKARYIGGIAHEMANARLYHFWGSLTTALRTGEPQNEARNGGQDPFKALYAHRRIASIPPAAMTGISRGANLAIARQFPWKQYKTVVDVGTAQGDLVTQVTLANPHLEGIGFDLPPGWSIFKEYVAAQRTAGGGAPTRQLARRPHPEGGRRLDGPHPARLGSRHQKDAYPESV